MAPGAEMDFVVDFSPRAAGDFNGNLSITTSVTGTINVELNGQGLPINVPGGGPIHPF